MVVFLCDGCGDTLRKNQVDIHANKCRTCASVSCVDCSVSFWGDDYRTHTSCVSEAERYEKTVYRGPKKGDKSRKMTPQEAWMEVIHQSLHDSPPKYLLSHLEQISCLDNVPRKAKPFRNFACNSLRLRGNNTTDMKIVDSIWKHLCTVKEKGLKKKEQADKLEVNDQSPKIKDKQAEKESKGVQNEESVGMKEKNVGDVVHRENQTSNHGNKKKLKSAMKRVLKKAPKHRLKLKDLRKMIENEKIWISSHENESKTSKKGLKRLILEQVKLREKMVK